MAVAERELALKGARVYRFPVERIAARRRAMYRRRRLGVASVLATIVVGLIMAGGSGQAALTKDSAPRTVVIQPGQTLWDVAERYAAPGTDLRAYVDALQERNDLGGVVPAGLQLDLP